MVEGRDDITAVKRALDAEVLAVGGFGINRSVIDKIKEAQKRQGVIILTDPDFAGDKIRSIITKRVPGVKHAYISQAEGTKDGDIGVENASPETIIRAIKKAKCEIKDKVITFTITDMMNYGLVGDKKSSLKRDKLGKELGIGYANSARFLSRLNNFGIEKKEFLEALASMELNNK